MSQGHLERRRWVNSHNEHIKSLNLELPEWYKMGVLPCDVHRPAMIQMHYIGSMLLYLQVLDQSSKSKSFQNAENARIIISNNISGSFRWH